MYTDFELKGKVQMQGDRKTEDWPSKNIPQLSLIYRVRKSNINIGSNTFSLSSKRVKAVSSRSP